MNTEFKGTHGPWIRNGNHISQEGKHPHGQSFVIDTDHVLKGIQDKEGVANAQLMATAPELLEACQCAMRIHDLWRTSDGEIQPEFEQEAIALREMEDKLKTAINKALNPDTK